MKIAILGWGSLLWNKHPAFDEWHEEEWLSDGPNLEIEFSRVSAIRKGALTLVLDRTNGNSCQVAYTLSKRKNPDDAICDLRCREGTTLGNIGFYFADDSRKHSHDNEALNIVHEWALKMQIDVVIWTDLENNFERKSKFKEPFSIPNALLHIQALDDEGKAKAAEYVWRAPTFVNTPLRAMLQAEPWFQKGFGCRSEQGLRT